MPDSPNGPMPPPASGLLLSRDLFFNSKITGTAQALGRRVSVATSREKALEKLASEGPRVVFVDLGSGDLGSPEALGLLRQAAPGVPFIAFGSHVDTATLHAAQEVGCEEVMPRSKLTACLPDLIRQYLP